MHFRLKCHTVFAASKLPQCPGDNGDVYITLALLPILILLGAGVFCMVKCIFAFVVYLPWVPEATLLWQ